jgi:hypothetical protein
VLWPVVSALTACAAGVVEAAATACIEAAVCPAHDSRPRIWIAAITAPDWVRAKPLGTPDRIAARPAVAVSDNAPRPTCSQVTCVGVSETGALELVDVAEVGTESVAGTVTRSRATCWASVLLEVLDQTMMPILDSRIAPAARRTQSRLDQPRPAVLVAVECGVVPAAQHQATAPRMAPALEPTMQTRAARTACWPPRRRNPCGSGGRWWPS